MRGSGREVQREALGCLLSRRLPPRPTRPSRSGHHSPVCPCPLQGQFSHPSCALPVPGGILQRLPENLLCFLAALTPLAGTWPSPRVQPVLGFQKLRGPFLGLSRISPPGRCENVRHQAGPERLDPGPFVQHLGCTKARWFGRAVVGTVVFKQQDAHPLCALRGLSEGECGLPAAPSSSPPAPHRLYKARQTLPSPGGQLLGTKHREKGKL